MTIQLTVTTAAAGGPTYGLVLADPVVNAPVIGWPNATNTGVPVGTSLTVFNGTFTTTADNQVINARDIRGALQIRHNGVTISKTKVTFGGGFEYTVEVKPGLSVPPVFTDCEFMGRTSNSSIADKNVRLGCGTLLRCYIHGGADQVTPTPNTGTWPGTTGGPCLVKDCYIYFGMADYVNGMHADCIEADGNHHDVRIEHCNVVNDKGDNSALTCSNYWGPVTNFYANNNRFIGGNYSVYYGNFDNKAYTGLTFTNNRLKKGVYGYASTRPATGTVIISGNVDDATGQPISL